MTKKINYKVECERIKKYCNAEKVTYKDGTFTIIPKYYAEPNIGLTKFNSKKIEYNEIISEKICKLMILELEKIVNALSEYRKLEKKLIKNK